MLSYNANHNLVGINVIAMEYAGHAGYASPLMPLIDSDIYRDAGRPLIDSDIHRDAGRP